jgi:hypothetical protein
VLVSITLVSGCGASQIDPTEQSFSLWLHNDTGVPITVLQCVDDHCRHYGNVTVVMPGARTEAGTSARAVANPQLFKLSDGSVYGCLPLNFNSKPTPKPTLQISWGKGRRC